MAVSNTSGNLANLMATIDYVAVGGSPHDDNNEDEDSNIITADLMDDGTVGMLEGTVFHLSNGQSINVVEMTGSLDDHINVVQVETTELEDHDMTTVEEMCEIDIDTEEQQHILNETGAHVVVKTEDMISNVYLETDKDNDLPVTSRSEKGSSVVLPEIPFSFPGQSFDTKCQKLILNVWDFFKRLKKNPDLLDEIRTPQERAAAALHISAATIGKIGKNFKRTGKLETPGKKRKRTKPVVDAVTQEQEKVIRAIIKELKENRVTPTIPIVMNECRERINFQGGPTSFRRVLNRMGYKGFAKASSNNSSSKSKPVSQSSSTTTVMSSSHTHSPSKALQFSSSSEIEIKDEPHSYISIPLMSPVPQSPVKKTASKKAKSSNSAVTFSTSSENVPISISKQHASNLVSNLLGNNIFQMSSTSNGESITISEQTAAAIANATSGMGDGPQTIHLINSDNTVQQIQIVYANIQ